jgi:hypothetical protein
VTLPVRLPDAASHETVLAGLDPALADAALVPALARTFPGFEFSKARIDDDYWRDTHSVIRPDGARPGELRQLAKERVSARWAPRYSGLHRQGRAAGRLHDAIDRELGLPFGWVFLVTHGHWVKAEIGQAIATGLRELRVRLPDNDAGVLLRWADKPYGF